MLSLSSCNIDEYFTTESEWKCSKCSEYIVFHQNSEFSADLRTLENGTIVTRPHGFSINSSDGDIVSYKGRKGYGGDTGDEDVTVKLTFTEKKVDGEWVSCNKIMYFDISGDNGYLSGDDYFSSSSDKSFKRQYTSLFFE